MEWSIEVVMVPVEDVDAAKTFYADQLGFVVDHDTRVDDQTRLVQLTPPGSGCSVVLATGSMAPPPGDLRLQLVTDDIAAAHALLTDGGVDCTPVSHFEGSEMVDGPGGTWNSFVFFSDPDGHRWTVQERPRPTSTVG